jgi:hypothetical protein
MARHPIRRVVATAPTFFAAYAVCDSFSCEFGARAGEHGDAFESVVREHTGMTGHTVSVEFVTQIKYAPRDPESVDEGGPTTRALYDAIGTMAQLYPKDAPTQQIPLSDDDELRLM